jgi:hypothetical protein
MSGDRTAYNREQKARRRAAARVVDNLVDTDELARTIADRIADRILSALADKTRTIEAAADRILSAVADTEGVRGQFRFPGDTHPAPKGLGVSEWSPADADNSQRGRGRADADTPRTRTAPPCPACGRLRYASSTCEHCGAP